MLKDAQLERMTVKELRELSGRIDVAIAARQQREKAELKDRMIQMAQEAGLSLSDVIGGRVNGKATRGGKGSVPVKYQHPDDASMTWTGRGRRPKWLENVTNIEKFRVG